MVMQENFRVVVLIPAYKPDERLIQLTRKLRDEKLDVLLVDDGGGEQYAPIFEQCRALGAEVAVHAVNQGKGRALKTGLNAAMLIWKDMAGVVTADADGQHTPRDILRIIEAMREHPNALVLGSRDSRERFPSRAAGGTASRALSMRSPPRAYRRYADGSARYSGVGDSDDGDHRRRTL